MGTLTRLSDFETDRDAVPPVLISATKMDAEFDQLVTESNAQDVRLDAAEAAGHVSTADLADDAVDGDKIAANAVDSEHYVDGSIDNEHIADDAVNSEHYAAGSIDLEHMSANSVDSDQYVDGSIDLAHMSANSVDSDQYVDGSIDLAHMSANSVDSDQYVDGSIDLAHMSANSVDSDQYVDGSIDSAHIGADQVITAKILDSNVTLPKIVDASATNKVLGRVASGSGNWEEVTLQTTLSSSDEAIPTSKAVRDDIVSLVNDIGGFVAIATEVAFPNANPDPDDGAGTVVSIANVGGLVVNGSGVSTTGRTVGGATVTINSISSTYYSTTIADGLGMQVVSTAVLNTYNYHKIIAKEGDTNIVSTNIANVNTTAAAIANVNTTADAIANVNLVGGSITNVNTVATNVANVNTTAANISGVNSFAERYRVASSAPVADLDAGDLYFDTTLNELKSYGSSWQSTAPSAANQANINIVAGELVYEEDLGSIADAVTSTSGNNITDVAGAIANINLLAPSAVIADMALLGTTACIADMALLGTTACIADMALLGTTACIADMALLGDSAVITDMDLLGATGVIDDLETVSNAIADVNRYADEYTIASSAPGSPSEGDLWYDSTNNVLKYYTGSIFASISAGISDVVSDTSPTLGGPLDADGENITNCGTISGANLQMDFGSVA